VSRLSNLQGSNDASSSKNNPKALTDESGRIYLNLIKYRSFSSNLPFDIFMCIIM
jgi:hypothetical protein